MSEVNYRLDWTSDQGKPIKGAVTTKNEKNLSKLANSLNEKYPKRHYHVEPIKPEEKLIMGLLTKHEEPFIQYQIPFVDGNWKNKKFTIEHLRQLADKLESSNVLMCAFGIEINSINKCPVLIVSVLEEGKEPEKP